MAKAATVEAPAETPSPAGSPWLALILAWLIPGAGHVYLARQARGALYFVLVLTSVLLGCWLQGELPVSMTGLLKSFYALTGFALGLPYLVLRFLLDYSGEIRSAGFEYGTAFLITAGLMNSLLILDAWEIASGRKG